MFEPRQMLSLSTCGWAVSAGGASPVLKVLEYFVQRLDSLETIENLADRESVMNVTIWESIQYFPATAYSL